MKTNVDITDYRVYIDAEADSIYDELVSQAARSAEDCPFVTMKDLFMLAACVGAYYERFAEVGNRSKDIRGEIFKSKTDVPVLAALAFRRTKDVEVLTDAKTIMEIAQGWANGGIYIVRDELVGQPGRPLYNLIELIRKMNSAD
jgi:dnd system-associated protein 4